MHTRKKLARPDGSIVQASNLSLGDQCPGHTMLMSELLRENGITPDQVKIIDTDREFELISKSFLSASSLVNF